MRGLTPPCAVRRRGSGAAGSGSGTCGGSDDVNGRQRQQRASVLAPPQRRGGGSGVLTTAAAALSSSGVGMAAVVSGCSCSSLTQPLRPSPLPMPLAPPPQQQQPWRRHRRRRQQQQQQQQPLPLDSNSSGAIGGAVGASPVAAAAATRAAAEAPRAVLPTWLSPSAQKYRFLSKGRVTVYCAVQPTEAGYTAVVSLPAETVPPGLSPTLHWGLFRNNPTWVHPPEVVPKGSVRDEATGAMRSPLAYDEKRDVWALELKLPRKMAPVTLGFVLWFPENDSFDGTAAGRHFALPIGLAAGRASPLGPSLVATTRAPNPEDVRCTLNFAVFSRHATAMSLCLVRADGSGYLEVALDPLTHRTGDVWHVQLTGLKGVGTLCYGWRPNGPGSWAEGGRFHPAYVMLDPYAPRAMPVTLPQAAYDAAPLLPPEGSVQGPCLLGSLAHLVDAFDWGGAPRPRHAPEDSVVVELDVLGFTTGKDAEERVPPERRGTYLGVIDRIPELQQSGATAVLLGNVFLSSDKPAPPELLAAAAPGASPEVRRPLSFFAPDVRFVSGGDLAAAADQLKALIRALHEAGMEVLLEAEFCLTSESAGGIGGRLQSYAGLDGDMYLRGGGGPGAGGVLNTGQPVVRQLLRAALRHWVVEFQVDGFCLVSAENLTQDPLTNAVLDSPPVVEELAADPVLADCKLIAASANDALLPRGGARGFPHYARLMEWNNRFGRDVLALLRDNRPGVLSAFATRITGSPDLLAAQWDTPDLPGGLAAGRRPAFGVNALSPPLAGSLLRMCGADDDLDRAEIVARSLLLAVLVAQGTPALNAPTLSRKGLLRFVGGVLAVRAKYRHLLAPPSFDAPRTISWHAAPPDTPPDWTGEQAAGGIYASNYVGFLVADPALRQAVYVGFNPNPEQVPVSLPPPGVGLQWRRVVDTARMPPQDVTLEQGELLVYEYIVAPGAAVLMEAVPAAAPPVGASPPGSAAARTAASQAAAMYARQQGAGAGPPPPPPGAMPPQAMPPGASWPPAPPQQAPPPPGAWPPPQAPQQPGAWPPQQAPPQQPPQPRPWPPPID